MSRRFTDTNKWDDPWFCDLDAKSKLMWQYILDKCSIAGVWKINFKLLKFFCDSDKPESEIRETFTGRFFEFDDKWFIPKFLKYQYPRGLNSEKPAIIGVRNEILDYDKKLLEIIRQSLGNDYLIIKDKDKDKDKDKEKEKREEGVGEEKKDSPPTKKKCLFRNSGIGVENISEAFEKTEDVNNADAEFYYNSILDWSDSDSNMKTDWIATARNFARKDLGEGKLRTIDANIKKAKEIGVTVEVYTAMYKQWSTSPELRTKIKFEDYVKEFQGKH